MSSAASFRLEKDLLGSLEVPADAYYGIQTLRAVRNFHLSGVPLSHFPKLVVALAMVNGLYEETFLAGYLLEGLRKHGIHIALGITTLIRLLYHLYQGPIGAASVTAYGLVVMLFYWRSRLLWPIVFAHTLADITAFIP